MTLPGVDEWLVEVGDAHTHDEGLHVADNDGAGIVKIEFSSSPALVSVQPRRWLRRCF